MVVIDSYQKMFIEQKIEEGWGEFQFINRKQQLCSAKLKKEKSANFITNRFNQATSEWLFLS